METIKLIVSSVSSFHLLVVVIVLYTAFQTFIVNPPKLEEHRRANYHWVNAGLFCTGTLLLFIFGLRVHGVEPGVFLSLAAFLIWTGTVGVILSSGEIAKSPRHGSTLSAFVRRVSMIFICAAPIIVVFYDGGANGFFDDLDRYATLSPETAIVKHIPADNSQKPDDQSSTNSGDSSNQVSEARDSSQRSETKRSPILNDNSQVTPRWRVSHIPKGLFIFLQAFLVTSYYGTMLHYRHRDKLRTNKDLDSIGAMDQVIFVLSVAFSVWIVFLLLGFDTLSISIFSGLVAIGVSVALRDLLSNYVAGMMLLWDKSVKLHDVIAIGNSRVGRIKDITMRYMVVEDRSDVEYLVPHSQLINSTFENWTRRNKKVRLKLDIGVAYDSPIEKVKEIMRSVCFEVPRVLKHPLPNPLILSMDESAIHFQLRFRIADPEEGVRNVISDVYERLLIRFKAEGIEIPYAQREIRVRRPSRVDPRIVEPPNVDR